MTAARQHEATSFVAIDHRRLLERLVEEAGVPPDRRYARVVHLKRVVCEAVREVLAGPRDDPRRVGLLLDEQYAATEIARTKRAGLPVAMAVERNGAPEFTLEHGDGFGVHVSALQPDLVKVLFLYDDARAATVERLVRVWTWCQEQELPLLLEAIPVTGRTDSLADFIQALGARGIRPYQWKIPVPASQRQARAIADAARTVADGDARVVLLGGGGALPSVVDALVTTMSLDPAFTGWAVGRALWGEAVRSLACGTSTDAEARALVGANLSRLLQATSSSETRT